MNAGIKSFEQGRLDPSKETGLAQVRSRVFVGPARFAAGMPHKLHETAARAMSIVATGLLTMQLG
jgi:hypothetical protein